jgi:hypothetical protein
MHAADLLDTYLLTGGVDRGKLVERLLKERSAHERTAPFYRALESLGARTPEDALIALRIAMTGEAPSDARVLALRAVVAQARGAATEADREAVRSRYRRELGL